MTGINKVFAENLRRIRIQAGMTQKELADKLIYSEKSVSKWETGYGLPGIETILKICTICNIGIESLVYEKKDFCYLGINADGNNTQFLLTDNADKVIASATLSSSNPIDVGMLTSQKIISEGIRSVCAGVPFDRIYMFAGISGSMAGNNQKLLSDFFKEFGFKAFKNASDIHNSMALGLEKNDGIIVIMGTGISAYAVENGVQKPLSGWGQLFDTGGSEYNLGRDAIYAALSEQDGLGEKTELTQLITEILPSNIRAKLADIYAGGKGYIASFSPLVLKAAAHRDAVAIRILEHNMREVAIIVNAAARYLNSNTIEVAFTGSLIQKYPSLISSIQKYLDTSFNYTLKLITENPVCGAIKQAKELSEED